MRLDVFFEGPATFDRDAVETALAANGIGVDSTVATADGGAASVSVDDDTCGFFIETLTLDLARIVFDVARATGLAILPVDGTPVAIIVGDAAVPDELEPLRAHSPAQLFEALRESAARREEARGARSA